MKKRAIQNQLYKTATYIAWAFCVLTVLTQSPLRAESDDNRIDSLIEVFASNDRQRVNDAMAALEVIGEPAVPKLANALSDDRMMVRNFAAGALGKIGPEAEGALPELIEVLKRASGPVRGNAAWALGEVGPRAKAGVPILVRILKDRKEADPVRSFAAQSIGKIGHMDKDVMDTLVTLAWNRASIVDGVERISEQVAGAVRLAIRRNGPAFKEYVPRAIFLLQFEDEVTHSLASMLLGLIGPTAKEAVPALIASLEDDRRSDNRMIAATALGDIGDAKAVPALRKALKDSDSGVRSAAREALSALEKEKKNGRGFSLESK